MTQSTIALPPSITENEAKLYLAIKLFEIGRLSCGQAAELAGYSKRTFLELLGKHGVAMMDFPASEIQDDLSHVRGRRLYDCLALHECCSMQVWLRETELHDVS